MKKLCPSNGFKTFLRFVNHFKLTAVITYFLIPSLLQAQISSVSLSSYPGCGGATLVPFCIYSSQTATPVTIYYERQVTAAVWQGEGNQNYNNKTSYVMYNGDDLTSATVFRVRAIDGVTGTEFISNSVSVNPASWNPTRGTAQSIPTAYWGTGCGNVNYIEVANYFTSQGRPPFTVAFKKSTEATFVSVGETTNGIIINGIESNVNYDVKVTDKCGMVSYSTTRLGMGAGYDINSPATNCNNGQVTIHPSGDDRYKGIAPYSYALFKEGAAFNDSAFSSNNVFSGLGKATYNYYVKDACGNVSGGATLSLGEGTPTGYGTVSVANDSCLRNIAILAEPGKGVKP